MTTRPRLDSLIFEAMQRCNHACLHCYNVWQAEPSLLAARSPQGQLDTARTLAVLGMALDEIGCRHVTITGGEPLLRRDLSAIFDFLRERNVRISLISNGRLLTDLTAASLIQRGVEAFELPLLSHERETHDRLSASAEAWDAALSAMASIRKHHGRVVASFVATRLNIDHLYQAVRLAFGFGAQAFMFNRFIPGGRRRLHLREQLPSVEQVRTALAVAEAAPAGFCIPIACSIPIQPCLIDTRAYPHMGFGYCGIGTERAYYTLDPFGNLRPCNHSSMILGNLLESAFSDLVEGERLHCYAAALPASCTGCEQRLVCQGGCKAAAEACYGSADVTEPFLRAALAASNYAHPIRRGAAGLDACQSAPTATNGATESCNNPLTRC